MAEKRFIFAVPGDLDTPTGGYIYDKRMVEELRQQGWTIDIRTLSGRFPDPDAATLDSTYQTFAALPRRWVIVVDGLALGALPDIGRHLGPERPLVALVHHPLAMETGLSPERADALRESERAALSAASHVITVSATTAALLTNEYGIEKPRIKVVPPGTDQAPFAYGSTDGVVSLLSVGSVVPRKGYDLLVTALAGMKELPWRLIIAGDLTRDAEAAQQLHDVIAATGLADRVRLTGMISDEELGGHYHSADIFVLPSYYEGYGMVFAEALARGLPVVGTTGGAIPESVPAGAGILVPPGDVAALAGALRDMIERPELRAQHASAALRSADHLLRWPLSAELFGRAIEAVLP